MTSTAELPRWRRILRRVVQGSVAIALISAPWWGRAALQSLDFFRVRHVEIDGVRYAAPDQIVSRLRVDSTTSLWDRLDRFEARVLEHPQVRAVRISRRLPGTFVVHVTENLPVAWVPGPNGLVAVDAAGTRLPIDPTLVDADLPVLGATDLPVLRLLATLRSRTPALYARVSKVERRPHNELAFQLAEHPVLATSDVDAARLAELLPVEADLAQRGLRAAELDLRFRDQVIARLP